MTTLSIDAIPFDFDKGNRRLLKKLLRQLGAEALTLYRLGLAVKNKDYALATPDLMMVLAALGYVANPLDVVPDFVPVAGLGDDALVVAAVVAKLGYELICFRSWERRHHNGRYDG
ncbi:YkvA family protein [Demequina rhizosphaerae]|uniref:YkvA family protein n=1 Tax=Demequina rhizosphaerae TaxID=1638985 RepID=UPI000781D548|nr:YkvA family protein [Demequina rhizosphaerae]